MMRALFTAASGMIIQEKRQSNVANNLANVNTPAFKLQDLITKEKEKVMIQNRDRGNNGQIYMKNLGALSLGAEIDDLAIDFEQGTLQDSDRDLDLALEGEGFFKIQWSDMQIGYTRNGQFKLNSEGYLINQEGKRVLAQNNEPIFISDRKVSIGNDGTIFLDGDDEYQLDIVTLNTVDNLKVIGSGIYLVDNAQEVQTEDTKVYQNKLESSNINPLEEMVKMIEISRTFESNQKVLQAIDEMMSKSVNSIGKV